MRSRLSLLALVPVILAAGWMKSTRVESSIEIAAAPEDVWAVLMDFSDYPEWNPFITHISGTPAPGEQLLVQVEPVDRPDAVVQSAPSVRARVEAREFRWGERSAIPAFMEGEHYFLLEPTERGTRLILGGRSSGFADFFRNLDGMQLSLSAMNRALKARVERRAGRHAGLTLASG